MISLYLALALALATAHASVPPENIWLERFEGTDLHALGWQGVQEVKGKRDHVILREDGRSFVRSSYLPGTEAKYISKEVDWDCKEYPVLRWRWRARVFPTGARILESRLSDAPAQIYVVWKKGRRVSLIKYFWAAAENVGVSFEQSSIFFGRLYGLIIRSGGPLGEWHAESRDVVQDYRNAFNEDPPDHVSGIALLSDADETKSLAEADFTDFEAARAARTGLSSSVPPAGVSRNR